MPAVAAIYLCVYALLVGANCLYSFYGKSPVKGWMLAYESFSGAFIVFMACAFWLPGLRQWTGLGCVLTLAAVVLLDIRFSLSFEAKELGLSEEELDAKELDVLKGLSIAFAAPAYLMCLLLAADILMRRS